MRSAEGWDQGPDPHDRGRTKGLRSWGCHSGCHMAGPILTWGAAPAKTDVRVLEPEQVTHRGSRSQDLVPDQIKDSRRQENWISDKQQIPLVSPILHGTYLCSTEIYVCACISNAHTHMYIFLVYILHSYIKSQLGGILYLQHLITLNLEIQRIRIGPSP